MRLRSPYAVLSLILMSCVCNAADEPARGGGISAHMLPKQVADLSDRLKWGFVVDYADYLKPESSQPVLRSTAEVLAYVRKQDRAVQQNGLWIVTTHPAAYSAPETALLADVKAMCRREHIPLFIARGAELPDGWHRYDRGDSP